MEDYLEGLVMASQMLSPNARKNTYIEMCHGIAVSNLARILAWELGEKESFCDEISVAGLLHDIGKIRLSKYPVINWEKQLMVERMKYVWMHPTHSEQVLREQGYSETILQAVYSHHENYDGTGYPDNLRGEEIPWMGRILRVCDVFCALTSDRSYRRAFDRQSAIEIMIDEVADYDMKVFLAFQRLLHSERVRMTDGLGTELTPLQKEHLGIFVKEAEAPPSMEAKICTACKKN